RPARTPLRPPPSTRPTHRRPRPRHPRPRRTTPALPRRHPLPLLRTPAHPPRRPHRRTPTLPPQRPLQRPARRHPLPPGRAPGTTAHQTTDVAADIDLVSASLAYQYQDVPGLLSICSDADRWVGRRFTTDEVGIAAATRYVTELDTRSPKGIYAQVTTLREHPAKGRGGKDLAHALTWLWADGDYGTLGHKPGPDEMPHPVDADHVRDIVASSGLPEPSGWVDTGGGCNPVWTLTDIHV